MQGLKSLCSSQPSVSTIHYAPLPAAVLRKALDSSGYYCDKITIHKHAACLIHEMLHSVAAALVDLSAWWKV